MEIPLFLAMTAAEVCNAAQWPPHPAWMACHFSSYGTGLSNVPDNLPAGSMLMLNDRIPICGHDANEVAQTLCQAAEALRCDSIVLDFQRQDADELSAVVRAVLERASCPVGVSQLYAAGVDCPVLVPPIPPHQVPEDILSVWEGREVWLELSSEGTAITVTEDGSSYAPLPCFVPLGNREPELHCHYEITVQEDRICFQLGRTAGDQRSLIRAATALGVGKALGLWQEKSLLQLQQAQGISDQPKASSASLKAP